MSSIEQQRRDFKESDPDLYAYIAALECAKALDGAGDEVSGAQCGPDAANRLWRLHEIFKRRADVLLHKEVSPRR